MGEFDIATSEASNLAGVTQDFSVGSETTDAAGDSEETTWQSEDWNQNLGYYKMIPELKTAIDTKVTWVIGAGIETDDQTKLLLMSIKGNGKDSFSGILKNQISVAIIDGDSYAEIIRDEDRLLVNLKPLAPDSIKSVQNKQGRFIRYEQITKVNGKKNTKKFEPDEIFHLSRDRVADEIHGVSVIESVKWIIDARNEAMTDMKKLMHRYVIPRFNIKLDTDDLTKIGEFKTKYDKVTASGENIYTPMNTVEAELISVPPNATLSPLAWIDKLTDYFYQAVNVPQIIIGNAKEFTDASGKIVYLAFEQSVKASQLYVEEQVLGQLNLEINLTFPASLQTDTISDTPTETDKIEEEPIEQVTQPNDTTTELEGKT